MVSIVIPIYNGKKYIKSAINSCLNQCYNNIEIIVIDDGSTDNLSKSEILDLNSSIVFHSKSNEGLGKTRNLGIQMAKGDYIFFLDADDTIPSDAIYKLRSAIEDNDFIIGRCNRIHVDKNNNNYKEYIWKKKIYKRKHDKYNLIVDAISTNKLYKKEFLLQNSLKFLPGLYEDKLFVLKLFENSKYFKYIKDTVYHWNIHDDNFSITSSKSIYNLKERMNANNQCLLYTNDVLMKEVLCKNIVKHDFKLSIVKSSSEEYLNILYDLYIEFLYNNKEYIDSNSFFLDKIIIDNIENKELIIKEFKNIFYENNSSNIFIKIRKYIRYTVYYLRVKLL